MLIRVITNPVLVIEPSEAPKGSIITIYLRNVFLGEEAREYVGERARTMGGMLEVYTGGRWLPIMKLDFEGTIVKVDDKYMFLAEPRQVPINLPAGNYIVRYVMEDHVLVIREKPGIGTKVAESAASGLGFAIGSTIGSAIATALLLKVR